MISQAAGAGGTHWHDPVTSDTRRRHSHLISLNWGHVGSRIDAHVSAKILRVRFALIFSNCDRRRHCPGDYHLCEAVPAPFIGVCEKGTETVRIRLRNQE